MHQQLEDYLEQIRFQIKSLPQDKQNEEVQELQQHLLTIVESRMEEGDCEEEAVAAALRQFGRPRQVGRSLRKAWHSRSNAEGKVTIPLNKFVSAGLWSLAFSTLSGMLAAFIYGGYAGLWFGLQSRRGIASSGDVPGMEVWIAVVNIGPEVMGLAGLLLALSGRLPTFHIKRIAK